MLQTFSFMWKVWCEFLFTSKPPFITIAASLPAFHLWRLKVFKRQLRLFCILLKWGYQSLSCILFYSQDSPVCSSIHLVFDCNQLSCLLKKILFLGIIGEQKYMSHCVDVKQKLGITFLKLYKYANPQNI